MRASVRVTASSKRPPHPGRRSSCQRTASVSSRDARALIWSGFTAPARLAQFGASHPTRARAERCPLRSPQFGAQFRRPKRLRRPDRPVHPDWRGVRRRGRRANQARGAVRLPALHGALWTCPDLTPLSALTPKWSRRRESPGAPQVMRNVGRPRDLRDEYSPSRERLRERLERRLPVTSDGRIPLRAPAWAVRGIST